jgi:oligopeptide/dipeptide ABC transporter ATP-binding protein
VGKAILNVENLSVSYRTPSGVIDALTNIDLTLQEGKILSIVGESGSGKSTLALAISRLLDERVAVYRKGRIEFMGVDMITAKESVVRTLRGTSLFMIFQDPFASLNPLLRISDQLIEAISIRDERQGKQVDREKALEEAVDSLKAVRIGDARDIASRYPHQLSGGQNQRVMLAMALVEKPKLLIADEPTTALDATTQAQVLALLKELVTTTGMSVLFITHDLVTAGSISDTIAVTYAGMIMEYGSAKDVLNSPKHPYSVGLIHSVPSTSKDEGRLEPIKGSFSWASVPKGKCSFLPRCSYAHGACEVGVPALVVSEGRLVRCVNFGEKYDEQ